MSEEVPSLRLKSSAEIKAAAQQSLSNLKTSSQQGLLKIFLDCSGSISILLLVIGIIFIISTIASGVEGNKSNKNEDQKKSIKGFAAASGIFGGLCIIGAIVVFVLKKMTVK
jgi:hypothetical protein